MTVLLRSLTAGLVMIVMLAAGIAAQQILLPPLQLPAVPSQVVQGHNPEHCARVEGFTKDGELIHPCTCKRMGHGDGEDCTPDHEMADCKAYCKGEWCSCPVECVVLPSEPK